MPVLTRRQSQILRPRYDLTNGLVGWWTFDDAQAQDISGAQYNGSLVGQPQFTGGIVRNSLGGNGAFTSWSDSKYISLAACSITTSFTISAWIKLSSYSTVNNNPFIFDTGTGNNRWSFYASSYLNANKFAILKRNTAEYPASTAVPLGVWTHIVAVKSSSNTGTNLSFYMNGAANGTASVGAFTAPSGGTARIGTWSESATIPGQYMNGPIDDVRLYNRALSPGEVHALYAGAFQQSPWLDPMTYDPNAPTQYPFPINIPMLGF